MSPLLSSSSSLIRKRQRELSYDIFLSFNGDTRKNFTDHLYAALIRRGIETFRDDKSLEKGENFASEILEAIGKSWGSIIVFSKGYAFSHWCLKELVAIMKEKEEMGHRVYPIFYHVAEPDLRYKKNSVKDAFDKHKTRHDQETMEGWRVALKEVTAVNGWSLKHQGESGFIEDIVDDVSKKLKAFYKEHEVSALRKDNSRICETINVTTQRYIEMESANNVLRVQLMELTNRLRSLNSVLHIVEEVSGYAVDIPEIPDPMLQPWKLPSPNQPIMASADVFQY